MSGLEKAVQASVGDTLTAAEGRRALRGLRGSRFGRRRGTGAERRMSYARGAGHWWMSQGISRGDAETRRGGFLQANVRVSGSPPENPEEKI